MADAHGLGPCVLLDVEVRLLSSALKLFMTENNKNKDLAVTTEIVPTDVPYTYQVLTEAEDSVLWNMVRESLTAAKPIHYDVWLDTDGVPEQNAAKTYLLKTSDKRLALISHSEYSTSKGRQIVQTSLLSKTDMRNISTRAHEDIRTAEERLQFYVSAIAEFKLSQVWATQRMSEVIQSVEANNQDGWYLIPEGDTDKFLTIWEEGDKQLDIQAIKEVFRVHPNLAISYPKDYDGDTLARRVSYLRIIPAITHYGERRLLEYFDQTDLQAYRCSYLPDDLSILTQKVDQTKNYESVIQTLSNAVDETKRSLLILEKLISG